MKLRNKKTGKIIDLEEWTINDYGGDSIVIANRYDYVEYSYSSLKDFYEVWEDYTPAEPLIKDEKVRKAVRAWAEANNVTKVWHEGSSVGFCDGAVSIKFHELCWEEIPKGEYTIAELCGSEE